ncbi:DMT family transporter [Microbacterium sp. No. 7]|uniref:DMT family transporter n=1 Tax=Microbacterium sp. No. 7 TaxID=1714373 RepID=UPI0006D265B8|nr:EamA family transporter [Microbacterium sp. No. 7]ALJ19644.1 hypothetical protein AOA12_06870 [Microbacterium sp. No. 7]
MLPALAVLTAAVLFGTTGTSQALGPDASPLSIGVVRLAIGCSALAVAAAVLARRHARRRTGPGPVWSGRAGALMVTTGVAFALYQPLFFIGTERNGVAVSTVVGIGSAPVIAGVLEGVLTRRRPSPVWLVATALATVGVALLGFGGQAGAAGSFSAGATDPLGIAASIGAGASFAVLAVAQRRLLEAGWDSFTVVGAMGAVSAAIALVALPFVDLSWIGADRGVALALWLGLATVTVAYLLFTWGLVGLTAATAATLTLAEPVTAAVLGIVVLGEQLAPLAIAGLVVLVAGLALLAAGSRRARDPEPFAIEG